MSKHDTTDPYDTAQSFHKQQLDFGLGRALLEVLIEEGNESGDPTLCVTAAGRRTEASTERVQRVRDHHPRASAWLTTRSGGTGVALTDVGRAYARDDEYLPTPAFDDSAQQHLGDGEPTVEDDSDDDADEIEPGRAYTQTELPDSLIDAADDATEVYDD